MLQEETGLAGKAGARSVGLLHKKGFLGDSRLKKYLPMRDIWNPHSLWDHVD